MPIPRVLPPVGWFRLPKSGAVFHGLIPDGAVVLTDEEIDALEGGSAVGSEVAGADLVADADEIDLLATEELDDDVDGHEAT